MTEFAFKMQESMDTCLYFNLEEINFSYPRRNCTRVDVTGNFKRKKTGAKKIEESTQVLNRGTERGVGMNG